MLKIILVLLFVLLTSSALVVLKLGATEGGPVRYKNKRLSLNLNIFSATGIFLYGLSFLLYIYLISKNDLGYIIPLTTALVYIVVFPASHFLFKEKFSRIKVLGIILIVLGVVFLNLG